MLRLRFGRMVTLLALAAATPLEAQQLRGRLLDLESDEPIPMGMLTLVTTSGQTVAASISDDAGNWYLAAPGPGAYLIAARRIGFRPWTAGPVEVKAGEDLTFVYHLRRLPVMLRPTEVTARSTQRNLALAGFYERQRADFGYYITPEAIEKRKAARLTDLLIGLPGVHLVSMSGGSAGGLHVQLRAGNLSPAGVCRPRVFVDGIMFARGDARRPALDDPRTPAAERYIDEQLQRLEEGLNLDQIGPPSDIAAIEVYRSSSQVPVQFGGTSIETSCGVIVIWTKRGTPREVR